MIIDTTNTFNSPVRTVDGKAELYTSSAHLSSGEVFTFTSEAESNEILDFKVNVRRKNLIPYPYYNVSGTIKGITYKINSDNTITASGTATEDSFFYLVQTYRLAPGTYHLNSSNLTANNELRAAIYNLNNSLDRYVYNGSFTIKNEKLLYIYLVILKGATINNVTFNPYLILESPNVTLNYSPYITDLTTVPVTINGTVYYPNAQGVIDIDYTKSMSFSSSGVVTDISYRTPEQYTFLKNDAIKSITINRAGEMSKFFGFGISQETTIELIDKDRAINVNSLTDYFKIHFKANGDYINNFPSFYVSEVNRDENTNELTITAQDALYGAATHIVDELGLESPYTIRDVADACCGVLGLGLSIRVPEGDTAFDLNYPTGANFGGEETLRATLNAIAEATQTIYYLDNTDTLVFKRLDKSGDADLLIDKSNYFTLSSQEPKILSSIVNATELGDNVETVPIGEGVSQYVWNNPFWDMREDIATLIEDALTRVSGMTINQFECSWRGNFLLEIGDKINLITKDDNIITSYLLNDTIEYEGGFAQESSWTYEDNGETYTNPTSLGDVLAQTYAKVNKVDREIDIVASKADANSANLAQLRLTTDDISATVEDVRTNTNELLDTVDENMETLTQKVDAAITAEDVQIYISTELNKGIDKVTTATGFTFNEEGLTVSKSGSEMTTQITEDGMIVYRDNTAVLVANNEGVDATNLRATTYLIIGDNSRFEDYDNGTRTGCFWIG